MYKLFLPGACKHNITSLSLLAGTTVGECLLISSLPGEAWRTIVQSRGLPSDSTCDLKTEPGKLNIKTCRSGILREPFKYECK